MRPGVIEFYADNGNAFAFANGKQLPVSEWSSDIHAMIQRDIDRHPGAGFALEQMGLTDMLQQHEQYILCMHGDFNHTPDFIDFKSNRDSEFCSLLCGTRNCKYRGVLCNLIHADYGRLTDREVEICQTFVAFEKSQDVSDKLGISINTLNVHIASIMPKIGVRSTKGIVAWSSKHLTK